MARRGPSRTAARSRAWVRAAQIDRPARPYGPIHGPCRSSVHRRVPPADLVLTAEHQQVLAVAAHAGGQVVQPEQAGQPVVVPLALLESLAFLLEIVRKERSAPGDGLI